MMIEFDAKSTFEINTYEGFRAYFEAEGDGTSCLLTQRSDSTFDRAAAAQDIWPYAARCGCHDLPGEASSAQWTDGSAGCGAYKSDPMQCGLFGDSNLNGEGSANERCCACGGGFYPLYRLGIGEYLVSNGAYIMTSENCSLSLVLQNDGNLVLYDASNNPLWNTQTSGQGSQPYRFDMQSDGNAVLYSADQTYLWHSTTVGSGHTHVIINGLGQVSVVTLPSEP